MTKRKYRFGKPAMQRFLERNMLLVHSNMGVFPVWKRNHGKKGTNMWAFHVPQPEPAPQPEPPIVEIEVRDVEAEEPRTPHEEEDSEGSSQDDTATGGGLEEEARSGEQA